VRVRERRETAGDTAVGVEDGEDLTADAVLTLFAERGYYGTSVGRIAARLSIRTP
jgi:AcrR family transcriptional regulator